MLTHKLLRNLFRRGLRPINPQVQSLGREHAPAKTLNLRLCMAHAFAQIVPVRRFNGVAVLQASLATGSFIVPPTGPHLHP